MSSNRLIYDECEYAQRVKESTGPLLYTLNPIRAEHSNKCRHELGLLGGPVASHVKNKSLIDVESDLMGIRQASKCSSTKFQPTTKPEMVHLKSCQFVAYDPVLLPESMASESCPNKSYNADGSFSNNK